MDKIKVLCLFDSPTCNTGFGVLSRNLLRELYKTGKYEFDIIGINYHGDPHDLPYRIMPAMKPGEYDVMGRLKLIYALMGGIKPFDQQYDLVFTIQDHFIFEEQKTAEYIAGVQVIMSDPKLALSINGKQYRFDKVRQPFRWVSYWPVDSELKPNWVEKVIGFSEKKEILKHDNEELNIGERLSVIPHGVDLKTFRPLKRIKQFRKEYFKGKVKENDFLITNVSRNQSRKDIPRTLKAFKEIKKRIPNAKLYLHMRNDDVGGTIFEMANFLGLSDLEDYILPQSFNESVGVPVEVLNQIYNASDLLMTTTLGEGWGFILTEAMACKKPIIAPNNTSVTEIFGVDGDISLDVLDSTTTLRGIPVECGNNPSMYINLGREDKERYRPIADVDDLARKAQWVFKNPDKVEKMTDRAYKWVQDLSWDKVGKQWDALLTKAHENKVLEAITELIQSNEPSDTRDSGQTDQS
jgi:glycosyltransferase involved in cell wall biosynthesis